MATPCKAILPAVITHLLIILCLVFAWVSPALGQTALTILHTSEHHGTLQPIENGAFKGLGGVVRRGGLIERIRRETRHVLLLDSGDIGFRGIPGKKDRELRIDRNPAGDPLQIAEHAVGPERQCERDPDRHDVERGGKGRARQASERLHEAQAMMLQPGPHHWSFPWSSVRTRLRHFPIN